MHNAPRLMRGADRCTLMLHPVDAEARGIAAGDRVTVRTNVGAVTVPVEITDRLMPGVVSLPHGFGHARPGVRQSLAVEQPGAKLQRSVRSRAPRRLTGNAALSGIPVSVCRLAAVTA